MEREQLFLRAKPVWEEGKEKISNYTLLFRTEIEGKYALKDKVVIKLTGHTVYKLYINGNFVLHGPAKTAHSYWRVDELEINKYLTQEINTVSILVGGYYCYSYAYTGQPSFLCAEITCGSEVVAATGDFGFNAYFYKEKPIKVQRYSWQRPFSEVYCYETDNDIISEKNISRLPVELKETGEKKFIGRTSQFCEYEYTYVDKLVARGNVRYDENVDKKDDFFIYLSDKIKEYPTLPVGYSDDEAEFLPMYDALNLKFYDNADKNENFAKTTLNNAYITLAMPRNTTGMFCLNIKASTDVKIFVLFDEILKNNDVDFTRMNCANAIIWNLPEGDHKIETLEPYTAKYVKIVVLGQAMIEDFCIREVQFPKKGITHKINLPNQKLKDIYDAAVSSFRQNCVDSYMDCPSRERAGWLCDSYFIAQTEKLLTGKADVEHDFLENFILPDGFEYLPDGMLPMCYPADHFDCCYIPNWAMWFVLQLKEYYDWTKDEELINKAKEKIYKLLSFFRNYENSNGLLEKLDKWVFVEWSRANSLVQDISYPTNMLYSKFKECIGLLYHDEELLSEAKELKAEIKKQSFKGDFFCDNAIYNENGEAELSGESTEVCQYYAFYFGIATPDADPKLWETLINDFGPQRKEDNKYPEIAFANAFMGNYMRIDLLCKYGYYDKASKEIEDYFYYMANRTGTLWEMIDESASCDHGFAGYVVTWLDKIYN